MIVKVCEKLQTLTIYGWNIDPTFLENLGIMGTNLTNLHIIGANPRSNTISIHRLLSRLTSLSLDGNFKLSDAFVGQLVNRDTHLTQLQLSLSGLDRNTLMRICNNRNYLKLEKMALTDAHNLQDSDVEEFVKAFPKLKTLCIEGAVQITELSLLYAVWKCTDLLELDIRCNPRALEYSSGAMSANFEHPSSHTAINLQRLVLENIRYDDSVIQHLAGSLGKLKLIGLKNCPNITHRTLEALIMSCDKLQAFYIRECPGVGLDVFTELREVTMAVSASLTTVDIAHSGPTTPASVYNLCVSNPKLHTLSIEGYPNINDSVVGTFNTVNPHGRSKNSDLVVLDQKSIDALVNTEHPDLSYSGEGRTLSGYQISLLAGHLDMTYHDLITLMDEVAEAESNLLNGRGSVQSNSRGSMQSSGRVSVQHTLMRNQSTSRMNGISPRSSIDMKRKQQLNRMAALKERTSRPDTPSLWSNDYMKNGQDFFINDREENYNNMFNGNNGTSIFGKGDYKENESDDDNGNDDDDDDASNGTYDGVYDEDESEVENEEQKEEEEDDEDEDEEEEEEGDARDNFYDNMDGPQNRKRLSSTQNNNTTAGQIQDWNTLARQNGLSNMELGGWGGDLNGTWNHSPKATQNDFPNGLTAKKISQLDGSYPNQSTSEYVQEWRKNATNGNSQKKNSITQNRNMYSVTDNDTDGWGEAGKFVAWNDLRKQGYNADLIEQQKKTQFWHADETKWNALPTVEQLEARQLEHETFSSETQETKPVNFISLVSKEPSHRMRSNSCVSSSGSINLDEDDDIILKTTSDFPEPSSNSYRKPGPSAEQVKAKHSFQDWKTLKEPIERDERPSSRKDVNPTEISQGEIATDGWSNLAKSSKNRFSRTPRTNGNSNRKPSQRERDHIPLNQMAGNWGNFQQINQVNQVNNGNTRALTPVRSSSSLQGRQSPKNSYTPEPLIQMQNLMSITPEPVTQDLLIDTGDELNYTKPLMPTTFNNDLWDTTKNTNSNNNISSLNDDLASLDLAQTKMPETEIFNWSSNNSEKTPEKPLFIDPIVGTGHDTPDVEIDDFDQLTSETSQVSSHKKGGSDYLDDISQLMSPPPGEPMISPLLSEDTIKIENIQNELLSSTSASAALDAGTDVSSIASSPAPDNEIFSATISVETKQFDVQKIFLDENSDIRAVVEDFCKRYEMEDLVDRIYHYVNTSYTKKRTKKLFKKTKKKNTSASPNT
ncbi:hypothetical protein K501DRAFT_286914 [Backusella circina FSU 941]|nr:hypothetical protein K501DRAFT_286914 [Backusella circina FSU 941]